VLGESLERASIGPGSMKTGPARMILGEAGRKIRQVSIFLRSYHGGLVMQAMPAEVRFEQLLRFHDGAEMGHPSWVLRS
jgi:hypothetical protein